MKSADFQMDGWPWPLLLGTGKDVPALNAALHALGRVSAHPKTPSCSRCPVAMHCPSSDSRGLRMMSSSVTAIKVLPSASRLVHSLRDLGYDFPQAVADVIDNSVAAGATLVSIDLRFDGRDSWLRIADNGAGDGWRRRD